jgi:hypothetical protein
MKFNEPLLKRNCEAKKLGDSLELQKNVER